MNSKRTIYSIIVLILALASVGSVLAQEETPEPPTPSTETENAEQGTPFLGISFDAESEQVVVQQVQRNSPAAEADLAVGDIILSIDGETVTSDTIADVVLSYAPGDTVTLSIERDGETSDIEVTLGEQRRNRRQQNREQRFEFRLPERPFLGFDLEDTEDGVRVTRILEVSPAAMAGLQVDDLIVSVNGTDVETTQDVIEAVQAQEIGEGLTLEVERDGETLTIEVELMIIFETMPGFGQGEDRFFLPPFEGGPRDGGGMFPMPPGNRGEGRFFFQPNRPLLGVSFITLTEASAEELEVEFIEGAYIQEVLAESAADLSGIQAGDIITAVDGDAVDAERTLSDRLYAYEDGDTITLDVLRDGESLTIDVTLGLSMESSEAAAESNPA